MESKTTTDMKWYIVRTQGNKERSVSEKIRKDPDLENKVGLVLAPTETTYYLKNNKKIKREKIMYPGYIFVETNAVGELKYFLKGCNGATGFLTTRSGDIKPMSDVEVDKMIGHQKEAEEVSYVTPFIAGENIKIIDGPFSSMVGVIEEVIGQRVKLTINIFGRKTPIEVDILQIDKI